MAFLFKQQWTKWVDKATGKKVDPGTPGAVLKTFKSKKWYGKGIAGHDKNKGIPLCADKSLAQQMLNDLQKQGERREHGYLDPVLDAAKIPLTDHVQDWETSLRNRHVTAKHVQQSVGRVRKIIAECNFEFPPDITAYAVGLFLSCGLRPGKSGLPFGTPQETYTLKDAAGVLHVSRQTVRDLIEQHGLPVLGKGKSRRYPLATIKALWDRRQEMASVATQNYYRREMKSFCTWMVNNQRMPHNPLAAERSQNVQADRRHGRRSLTQDECRRLLATTQASPRSFRGLSGPDRMMIYATALGTGFRESALASLTPQQCVFGPQPCINLGARSRKNRKIRPPQPLNPDLAAALQAYLKGRPTTKPIWPGSWGTKGAAMLRRDLEAAGIPYVVQGVNGPEYADFHALRHTFGSELERAGVSLRHAMQLMDHGDPRLTMGVYSMANQQELAASINRLPALAGPGPVQSPLEEVQSLPPVEQGLLAITGLLLMGLLFPGLPPAEQNEILAG